MCPHPPETASAPIHHIGCVSFLNSKPLIDPLVGRPDVQVHFAVPADLLGLMESGAVTAALMSIVDYQVCRRDLLLVPAGMIGCDGPTLTVRIFSRVEPRQIRQLHADSDSHTSIILGQLILRERFGVTAEIVPLHAHAGEHYRGDSGPQTMLLIGDKVVNAAPDPLDYPHQLDLGEQWKQLTGLPFVFAMWMMRRDCLSRELAQLLADARHRGAGLTEQLLDRYCAEKAWPRDLARQYFTQYLRYQVTAAAREGLQKFFGLAAQHGLLSMRRDPQYFEISD